MHVYVEIETARMAAVVRSKLREVDRSNRRLDMMSTIFEQHLGRKTHHTCCNTCFDGGSDYLLLYELRKSLSETKQDSLFSPCDKNTTSDDESDDYDDVLDDFVSADEVRRKEEFEQQLRHRKVLQSKGYGCHVPDSAAHINACFISDSIQRGSRISASTVIHICDDSSAYSARLDLHLESLAERYIGTRFRRLSIRDGDNMRWVAHWMSSVVEATLTPVVAGSLLCFSGGQLVGWTNECFFHDSTIRHQDLLRFLDNHHVLSDFSPALATDQPNDTYESDDDADSLPLSVTSFCGDPRCLKSFPHEHIGAGVGSASGPSYLLSGSSTTCRDGDEALPRNFFTKV